MRLERRLSDLERRFEPETNGNAKRELHHFFARKCERLEGLEISEHWLANASQVDILAAGMNEAPNLPGVLADRLRSVVGIGGPVAVVATAILEKSD